MIKYFLTAALFFSLSAIAQTPALVKNINTAFGDGSGITEMTVVNDTLFFSATDGTNGYELWKSDGSNAGTVMVKNITPGSGSTDLKSLTAAGNLLFFTLLDGDQLWKSNGTATGTDTIISFPNINAIEQDELIGFNNKLLFKVNSSSSSTTDELWVSDGSPSGTFMLKSFTPLNGDGIGLLSEQSHMFNNELYFMASDGLIGREIWKTDGTVTGTMLLKDIRTSNSSSNDFWDPYFIEYNGMLYFSAPETGSDFEMWHTDGTTAGTQRFVDLRPGTGGSYPVNFAVANNTLFFVASPLTTFDWELWKTDGTVGGTVLLKDVYNPENVLPSGAQLFFTDNGSNPSPSGHELWVSDGTSAGTVMVKDINPGTADGIAYNKAFLTEMNGMLYFRANDGFNGTELWKSDGTATGTMMVKDLNPGSGSGFINNSSFFITGNGKLYFDGINQQSGNTSTELWESDGTTAGTLRHNIYATGDGSHPRNPLIMNNVLFFVANSGTIGRELWGLPLPIITHTPENNIEQQVHIYPNPSNGLFTIDAPQATRVEVFGVLGERVFQSETFQHQHININLTEYPAGLYLIKTTGSKPCIHKVVKQ